MQLERHPGAQAVAERAADLVAATLRAKPDAVLLLPAGSTPVPLYAELVKRTRARALDLSRARLFQLDEPCGVAPHDPRSFHAFLRRHLVDPLGLGARFHGLDGAAADGAGEIERHGSALLALGTPDLALLGLGSNGHVAFNEPGSAPDDPARVVALDAPTVRSLAGEFPGRCPSHGLTLGLREIAACRSVVMLVTGASKAAMLAHVLRGAPSRTCPATLLAQHPSFLVLADEDAARRTAPSTL